MTTLILIIVLMPSFCVACYPLLIRRLLAGNSRVTRPARGGRSPSLSVIVPCRGLEAHPTENIAALLGQEFATDAEILFCVESPHDPVLAVLTSVLETHPDQRARVIITGSAGDDLGKMHNLLGGCAAAVGERLVFLDSDVRLPDARYLERFTAGLDQPGVGLVTCFPAYRDCRNLPAVVTALMINNDLLGLFAVVGFRGALSVANGSCLAVDRGALEAAGGLVALRRQLLMDTVLARNILQAGYAVRLHAEGAPVVAGRMTAAQMRQQSRRWHLAMWRVLARPLYLGFAWLRAGFLLGFAACVARAGDQVVVGALALSLIIRYLVSLWLERRYLHSGALGRYWWLLPLLELFNGWEVLTAPLVRTVGWRGSTYHVDRRGRARPTASIGAGSKANQS